MADSEDVDMVAEDIENIASMDQDDDSSSSSESEDSDNDDDEKDKKIAELETQINDNPFMYSSHVELIKLLREEGELDKLRQARENMSHLFPLTAELWLDWIKDEMKLASTSEFDRIAITKLFERAVEDYMSVDVWLEYVQYAIGGMNNKNGIAGVRQTFDRALTAVGLHVIKGNVIWEAYRELEGILLDNIQTSNNQEDKQNEELDQQKKKLKALFRRQLSVPLFDMKSTYEEYKAWLAGEDMDPSEENSYQKALKKLDLLMPYEDALVNAESPRLEEYQKYIEFEMSQGDPSRVQCIFERALSENCLVPDLWLQYTEYLTYQLKIPHITVAAHERASRNCPWSVKLWQSYIVALERNQEPHEKIKGIVDKALASGFSDEQDYREIWLTFLYYLRRRINWEGEHAEELKELRETFQKAVEHLQSYFPAEADANGSIRQYWATLEAKYCKNMEEARRIWNDLMAEGHNKEASMWLEYYNLEKSYGDIKHCRKILQRAVQSTYDWPETIFEAYLKFEQVEGTLEYWDAAVVKCENQVKKVNERRQKQAQQEAFAKHMQEEKVEHKRKVRSEKKAEKKEESRHKRKYQKEEEIQKDKEGFKIPPPPSFKSPISEPPEKKAKVSELKRGEFVKHDTRKDDKTVFLSNLSYSTEEDTIRSFFASVGEISSLRLVRDYKGRSKGYCYVEFESHEAVTKAFGLDRQLIDNRPAFVSPCKDKKNMEPSLSKFKYRVGLEKNKLFVKNLPFSCTKEQLDELFSKHGKLKEIRMVTYRSGKFKGLAFIEFVNDADASQALLKTDGLDLDGHIISVALSNPPPRGQPQGFGEPLLIPTLGRGSKDIGSRGRARSSGISLVPRSVQCAQGSSNTTTSISKKDSIKNGDNEPTLTTSKMNMEETMPISMQDYSPTVIITEAVVNQQKQILDTVKDLQSVIKDCMLNKLKAINAY